MLCTLTNYSEHQLWELILDAVSVLNTYVVHDYQLYLNGLDAYILNTVHSYVASTTAINNAAASASQLLTIN